MMVLSVTMPKRIPADTSCQKDHKIFKTNIVDNVDPENWQALEREWKYCAVNSTGNRSHNSSRIPVKPNIHQANIIIKISIATKLHYFCVCEKCIR